MIKINLLPGYIAERKRIKMAWIASGALMVLVLAALIGLWINLQREGSEWDQKAREAAEGKTKAEGITAEATNERSKIQPIQDWVNFIEDGSKHNKRWADLTREVIKYTYAKVRYTSLQPAQNTITLQAVTDSTDSAARYLMNMMLNTSVWSSVSISGVPGDGVQIVNGEGFRTGGSAANTTSRPGGGGMLGGGQGMGMGKGPGMAGMGGGGMGMGKGPGMAAMGGGGSPGQGGTPGGAQAVAGQEGFAFTVVCQLVRPLSPPVPPVAGGGGAGGMGGMPGGGGGMPGMMGGGGAPGGMMGGGGMPGGGMMKGPGMMPGGGGGMPGGGQPGGGMMKGPGMMPGGGGMPGGAAPGASKGRGVGAIGGRGAEEEGL